jgi:tetratricopeptide (TPR) repeat protein
VRSAAAHQAIADCRPWCRQPDASARWFNCFCSGTPRPGRVAAFRRARPEPKLDRAWYGLGLVLIRLQRPVEAVAALKKNTELQPMSPYGWYQLARVQFDRQEPEETKKIIRHLKGFEPKVAAQLERETGLVG